MFYAQCKHLKPLDPTTKFTFWPERVFFRTLIFWFSPFSAQTCSCLRSHSKIYMIYMMKNIYIYILWKKCLRPLFSRNQVFSPCRWSRPAYPINFDPSIRNFLCKKQKLNNFFEFHAKFPKITQIKKPLRNLLVS